MWPSLVTIQLPCPSGVLALPTTVGLAAAADAPGIPAAATVPAKHMAVDASAITRRLVVRRLSTLREVEHNASRMRDISARAPSSLTWFSIFVVLGGTPQSFWGIAPRSPGGRISPPGVNLRGRLRGAGGEPRRASIR